MSPIDAKKDLTAVFSIVDKFLTDKHISVDTSLQTYLENLIDRDTAIPVLFEKDSYSREEDAYCPNCNHFIGEDAVEFCPDCGQRLKF